jgi:hypothetical protein
MIFSKALKIHHLTILFLKNLKKTKKPTNIMKKHVLLLLALAFLGYQKATATYAITGIQHASKPGQCDGSIDLTAVGNAGPFTFKWSNGKTTEDISGLCAAVYSVTITNKYGCETVLTQEIRNCSEVQYGTPTDDLQLIITNIIITPLKNYMGGALEVEYIGGAGGLPVYFKWTRNYGLFVGNTKKITDLTWGGDYLIEITNGCSSTSRIVHMKSCDYYPSQLSTIGFNPVNACKNIAGGGGYLTAVPVGGLAPFSYKWENSTETTAKIMINNQHDQLYKVTVNDYCGVKSQVGEIFLPCECHFGVEKFTPVFDRIDPCSKWFDNGVFDNDNSGLQFKTINSPLGTPAMPFPNDWFLYNITWEGDFSGMQHSVAKKNPANITSGIDFYDVNDGPNASDQVSVVVEDLMGCKVFRCYGFGKADENDDKLTSFATSSIKKAINWESFSEEFGKNLVYTDCTDCKPCGGDCDGGLGFNPTCNGEPKTLEYSSEDGDFKRTLDKLQNPCTSGTIRCSEDSERSYFIPDYVIGKMFPDYSKIIGAFEGKCIYACGCYFEPGEIPNVPSDHPFFVMSEIISYSDCELPPDTNAWTTPNPTPPIDGTSCPPVEGVLDPFSYNFEECTADIRCPVGDMEFLGEVLVSGYCFSTIPLIESPAMWTKIACCDLDHVPFEGDLLEQIPYPNTNPEHLWPCNILDGFAPGNPDLSKLTINQTDYINQVEIKAKRQSHTDFRFQSKQKVQIKSSKTSAISITPNPTTGKFTLKTTATKTPSTLRIWNATSQQILQKNLGTGVENLQIDLSGNPPGVYTLFLSNEMGTEVAKIVVQ